MKRFTLFFTLAVLSFLPSFGQDDMESKIEQFVQERLVFDIQGQYAKRHGTFLAYEVNLGYNITPKLYAYALSGKLWQLRQEDGIRSYCSANILGGGMGYRLLGCSKEKVSLDLRLSLAQSVGSNSLNCTVYDGQLRFRLGGKHFVRTVGAGFKHVHSHTAGMPTHNYPYIAFGFGF
jgi:hypothetical protein